MTLAKLNKLPRLSQLETLLQSLAMLDSILSQQLGEPIYSFSEKWSKNQSVGSIKNGLGDDLFFVFDSHGCFVKGWVHNIALSSSMESMEQMRLLVPEEFAKYLSEPAFVCEEATFLAWRLNDSSSWCSAGTHGIDDGSEYLLGFLKCGPESFQLWAEENYEVNVCLESVKKLYNWEPLTNEIVHALNPSAKIGVIREEASRIGYPLCILRKA